jgi:hypothetical protein
MMAAATPMAGSIIAACRRAIRAAKVSFSGNSYGMKLIVCHTL